LFKFPLLLQLT